ncbi:MAG: hypothetical protein KAS95_02930 [Candidatus Heimdallarchaeota archaeon]|nr:hypothetical protein [Candidatus Heimdallarchaeota archaeon]
MKATYILPLTENIEKILEKIAENYKTDVKKEDMNDGYFILAKPKLQIASAVETSNYIIHVWGASEEDINYLTTMFDNPIRTSSEKLSTLEFAQELLILPNIDSLSKDEIIDFMQLSEQDYDQYKKLLRLSVMRQSPHNAVEQIYKILEKKQ